MKNTFNNLNYSKWYKENSFEKLLHCKKKEEDIDKKVQKGIYDNVDINNGTEYPPETDDLLRLHYLVRTRKVLNILEFGIGKSTIIFADALKKNKEEYADYVLKNIRREDPFIVYTIDNFKEWISNCKKQVPKELKEHVSFSYSEVEMTTFNGRACTMYKKLPNVCPDLIYLDAPSQFGVVGDVRGISTESVNRLPMSADILLLEPFLLPGTLIVVDGRTANARFLKNNLQREWEYYHFINEDIHLFELVESPLGVLNAKQIKFCLGEDSKCLKVR